MDAIISYFFSKFGALSLVGFGVTFCIIWITTHLNAQKGTTVSVLWGLVQYTKRDHGSSKAVKASTLDPNQSVPAIEDETDKQPDISDRLASSEDFVAGRNLETLDGENIATFPKREYIGFTSDWIAGVKQTLKDLTTSQRTRKLQTLVGEKWAVVAGVVDNVIESEANETCIIVVKKGESTFWIQLDKESSKVAETLHKGDSVCVHGEFSPKDLHYFINGSNLERTTKQAEMVGGSA